MGDEEPDIRGLGPGRFGPHIHQEQADAKGLLQETLDEEGKADELLTQIATGGMMRTGVNEQAVS